ncbi:carbamoyl phosphate synthase small subunit [Vulcanisaeta sp. EB80]|uniref:glutamine-hydrolyzing carbamoyl-phosphate synthase small subunit n=1 Tax=Vulcanisaeta sp. EB80 TaxID=1650660 RepID=UPI0009BFDC93|nr:glutamine-hydrolyzing carbamoyl-phosphate synthase small subunit [Vulcanisaeta sp. EB80]PLC68518.1 carbamoyl phosphate synthase small subunit [Vulcanisaeta sp. EB80]
MRRRYLVLQDGSVYRGYAFGAVTNAVGEVVFTTANVGYPESLTDPSYKGQILVFTSPLIGNYGVSQDQWESDSIQVSGVVVFDATSPSHYTSVMSLDEWLRREGVPGVFRVDTRALTVKLREVGVMMGTIVDDVNEGLRLVRDAPRYDEIDFTRLVSPKDIISYGDDDKPCIGIIDCGVKLGIVRSLLARGFRVVRYPCHMWSEAISNCDGVLLSNGPGNPNLLSFLVDAVVDIIRDRKPTLGICLGHQVIALGIGARLYKMKYGHRAINKPVLDLLRNRVYITTHNHGYAVDPQSIKGTGFKVWAVQPDDKTVEGLIHEELPIITTQFHPEARPGPQDTNWVFDEFARLVMRYGR